MSTTNTPSATPASDTPLTDKHAYGGQWETVIPADFARTLETRLRAAEELLREAQRIDYFYDLNEAVGLVEPDSPAWISDLAVVSIAHATAAQRAEAFLRTIGKWEESTKETTK